MLKLALAAALLATPALAEEARPLRLIGEAPAAADAAPKRFIIDAALSEGDGPLQYQVEGWFAGLPPLPDGRIGAGDAEGSCVEERCVLTVDLDDHKLLLTGDLARPGGGSGRFVLKDSDDKTVAEGPATFTAFKDEVPGFGRLSAPDAFTGQDLAELLLWAGYPTGFSNIYDDPPGDTEREAFARWQGGANRTSSGLFLEADIAALRAEAAAAKAAVGWEPFNDPKIGWKAGYPSKQLRSLSVSPSPSERRFASDDGAATLVVRTEPAISDDAWDDFVDAQTDESKGRDTNGYTRVNDDFELNYVEGKRAVAAYYFHGDTGVRVMEFSYPSGQEERWSSTAAILQYAFRAGDAER